MPAFQLQGTLLKLVPVPIMLHIVLLATTLRLACYGLLHRAGSVWSVLPVELLHGVTFACGWGAATVYASKVAPPGLSATMQVRIQCVLSHMRLGCPLWQMNPKYVIT